MWCDPDDWYEPTMCEDMYACITNSKADLVQCASFIKYSANEERKEGDYLALVKTIEEQKGLQVVSASTILLITYPVWNKIFRKAIIEKYSIIFPDGLSYDDSVFVLNYMAVCNNIFNLPKQLYNYHRRSGSIMNKTAQKATKMVLEQAQIIVPSFTFLKKNDLLTKYNDAFLIIAYRYFLASIKYCKGSYIKKLIKLHHDAFSLFQINLSIFNEQERKIVEYILSNKYKKIKKIYYPNSKQNNKRYSFVKKIFRISLSKKNKEFSVTILFITFSIKVNNSIKIL